MLIREARPPPAPEPTLPPSVVRSVRPAVVLAVGGVGLLVAVGFALAVGAYGLSPGDVARAVADGVLGRRRYDTADTLVLDMRLPRAVAAMSVGAALATAGCMLQAMLRNPLASPFVVGTAQASGFGAVLAITLGASRVGVLGTAFVAAVLAMMLVLSLARTRRSLPTESVVLTGLAVSLLFGAMTGLLRYFARDEAVVGRITLWVLGGLWHVTWAPLAVLTPATVAAVALACVGWRRLDVLALGEADAARLGLDVRRTGTALLLLACALTSLAVCTGGVVAFVGLLVPHAARRLVGPAHRALLPASALLGAAFVLAADVVARTALPPEELPLGVVTSLVGVPAFLVLLRSMRARGGAA